MAKKNTWKDYFVFSKKERNAVIVLLVLMFLTLVLPAFFKSPKAEIPIIDLSLQKQVDSVLDKNDTYNQNNYSSSNNDDKYSGSGSYSSSSNNIKLSLFNFDPNTLSEEGFQKLGIPQRNINTIIHYREKGGRFRKPDDIKKIYGLSENMLSQLIPYIKIAGSAESNPISNYYKANEGEYGSNKPSSFKEKINSININAASEEDWKSLPGIGDVLSKRIVKFRNSMGGFKSIDDVARTYGLTDSVFQKLKPFLKME